MTNHGDGIDQDAFCKLTGATRNQLLLYSRGDYPLLPGVHLASEIERGKRLTYPDALAIEVARQVGIDWRVAPPVALRIVSYAGAVEEFLAAGAAGYVGTHSDFWFAVVTLGTHDTDYGSDDLQSFWVNSATDDHLMHGHYTGSIHEVMAKVKARIEDEERSAANYKQIADPVRVLFVNVSAADRRLRARAKAMNIAL